MISALAQTLTSPTNRKIKAASARTCAHVTPSCWAFSYDFFIINTSGGKLSRARRKSEEETFCKINTDRRVPAVHSRGRREWFSLWLLPAPPLQQPSRPLRRGWVGGKGLGLPLPPLPFLPALTCGTTSNGGEVNYNGRLRARDSVSQL